MPILKIPKAALPGLTAISKFEAGQVEKFVNYLASMPAGTRMEEIVSFLNNNLTISQKQSEDVVQTLISFRTLLEPADVNFKELSDKVTASYVEATSSGEENLRGNLLQIFGNFKTLKLTLKADTLLSHDGAIYSESKIVTDIRIIFSDDLEEKNRNAVLVHNLNIEYYINNETKMFNVSMTLTDLKNLQEVVERAISKEGIIIKDYSSEFKFINSINK